MYIEDLKFSLWADFIERDFLDNEFRELIDAKIINGATSNPSIFKNAILNSPAYLSQLQTLEDLEPKQKYEAVAIYDIQKAADILRPLYDKGDDGYVSIEVDPHLCDDAEGTIAEGKRLFATIDRPNVMIKVPATEAGYKAMEALTSEGIHVNATLIFKKEQAINCAEAFAKGVAKHGSKVDTVISIFVSRVDRALDAHLKNNGIDVALSGIYNTADIYSTIKEMNVKGCRALFASTGVKDDSLPAYYYIEKLLAYNTVNTAPIETINAYVQNGGKEKALPIDSSIIQAHFDKIAAAGIDFDLVLTQQIEDGLEAFKDAFQEILEAL
ncbi:transaldolase [Sulfurimonas sp. C5]|uniref:transaldolase n=1 Tax=Sulfurimonas sp. C5 TaxID=3036947 RepID=UPI0024574B49|nr:transaldolase [Sulfurimonas sp. C5]MDH4945149.1 transaldolase [Sulfurimonas sp. C5]